tara:strand:- start:159 stop:395 length:237 start_codon:yes stop_codon:yes gene_type:complete
LPSQEVPSETWFFATLRVAFLFLAFSFSGLSFQASAFLLSQSLPLTCRQPFLSAPDCLSAAPFVVKNTVSQALRVVSF